MPPKITQQKIEELRRLCQMASPLPWEPEYDNIHGVEVFTGSWIVEYGNRTWTPGSGTNEDNSNAQLVAQMRNWFPEFLDDIQRNIKGFTVVTTRRRGCSK